MTWEHLLVSPLEFVFLVVAGIAGGLAGSIAGLASLTTYPALLALGLPPVTANVTNTVALIFSSIGSVLGSRPELKGQAKGLKPLVPAALIGGATGAALLLSTPAEGFEKAVPFLLGFASLTILIPRRGSMNDPEVPVRPSRRELIVQGVGIFLIAIYGGYFGAAAGVLLLALLLHTSRASLPRSNAAKNVLLGIANGVAALAFVFLAPVDWSAVIPLGLGCLIGARIGPIVVRVAPARILRWVIGAAGLALAVKLGISAYG
jgi:uncharacterized membrane protein YfcA